MRRRREDARGARRCFWEFAHDMRANTHRVPGYRENFLVGKREPILFRDGLVVLAASMRDDSGLLVEMAPQVSDIGGIRKVEL